ncbi:peritrophin-1-like [Phymastichus coffea]|uniref:peritrophin-1-like n=1 Tax=Phymastichus coffea TaxID=108790 RepID=UPI00273B8294|nr:peritrophin-1-like [Phymastichus coffea]
MNVFATLSIVCIAAIAYTASDALDFSGNIPDDFCPKENSENVTFRPNADNCTTYYVCESGFPILMNCPPGLNFNPRENVCDWPALACCDKKFWDTKYCQEHPR